MLLIAVLAHQIRVLRPGPRPLREAQADLARVLSLSEGTLPILVPKQHSYTELAYYAPESIRDRLYYPIQHQQIFVALST